MTRRRGAPAELAGSLLLAHPSLADPNFRRTVVLMSAHSGDGALGVVINRPMGRTLAEISGDFAMSDLADVPVYFGGPVNEKQLILSAWEASEQAGTLRLYFGIDPEKAGELKRSHEGIRLRAYLGYSGWSGGQLEGELGDNAWVVAPVEGMLLEDVEGEGLWRAIIGRVSPELRLMAEAPEEPGLN
ncbi:YqgE/AlgH family protein [Opitutales bacterium ASA1]|uniref:YqgE/AlgH family protein n=1 Tax=Congregicoccus parvus TaxID=3081749 RepID=UPI002B2CD9A0|nr:YqgE/AlgH family protein [Opitutales bacterium ASA1]